ncbi:Rz1-like lysis system protein LysC [Pleomorphomonas carboxyditropha]|uniref:Uncharacterized protein n=1 Tax=Pleomorphomonas carboxyditropha TaxID=2023338 RepID=A0A2G9X186_9HYPH|nr:hypothetical protein [Pleomorphomonas carboxyditropha]PIP00695.1 hypothetical protein CJ014_00900 [Pleomorphomonas carboxyditropha]
MTVILALVVGFVVLKLLKFGVRLLPYVVVGVAVMFVTGGLTGCATRPTETVPVVTVLPPPPIPDSLLHCKSEPSVGRLATQRDAARYVLDLREAGADCRGKLDVVGGILRSDKANAAEISPGSK